MAGEEAAEEEGVGRIERLLTLPNRQELQSILMMLPRFTRILRNRDKGPVQLGQLAKMEKDREGVGREISSHSVRLVRCKDEV